MKFLPQKLREKQEEFLGKLGINWHLICVVFENNNSHSFVHLFESTAQT